MYDIQSTKTSISCTVETVTELYTSEKYLYNEKKGIEPICTPKVVSHKMYDCVETKVARFLMFLQYLILAY